MAAAAGLRHMETYAHFLNMTDSEINETASPVVQPETPLLGPRRVRKVSALSDFAPVNLKVRKSFSRRKRGERNDGRRQELLYLLVRWPLLTLISVFILAEFGFYVLIRQIVNAKEWLSAWRGRKGLLRLQLRGSKTYQEWKDAAHTLDEYLEFDAWKAVAEDSFYDWKLVNKVRRSLRTLREKKDVRGLLGVLEMCVRDNFGGVESARLYSETFYGTKYLIESFINEQEKALRYIRESNAISIEEKKRFYRSINTNLGATALCLSGGASFGYYHFGVVKAFLDADLLPRVVSGTSAGGLIAAFVCCYMEDELKALLVPQLANRITACEEPFSVWFKRFWTTGARFDTLAWAKKCTFFTRGSLTFREAYLRTGRILNISVIPADRHSPTKLLNYMTAPDCVIWSALLASAAVPGILNSVVLMQKMKDGTITPWSWGTKFRDGSLRVDIPVQALNLYFNVTHPIVSQVNPHVHLFFFAPQGSAGKPVAHRKGKGKGWRGNFLLSAAEQWLKLELTKNFKLIRDLDLLPQLLGQDWSSVFLQRFDGTVTIWPRTRLMDWFHILSDPDPPELERMMGVGQLVTWPKLHMIKNRHRIENEVLLGRQAVRRTLQSKEKYREVAKPQSGLLPEPITGTRLPQDGTDTGPVPTTSETPMSMDTDAEDAFKKGSRWFFKQDTSKSGSSTPHNKGTELRDARHTNGVASQPLTWRGNWPSSLFSTQGTDHPPTSPPPTTTEQTQQPSEAVPQNAAPLPSPSIFSRIRRKSVLSSPFSTLRHTVARVGSRPASEYGVGDAHGSWSSDTSSDGDLPSPEWRGSRHQQFPSLISFEDVGDIPILSSPDDEAESDGHANLEAVAKDAEQDS
ncbi:patatin-domain-containing protein [Thelephora ganbajun]|uniref:Patatin-domain-containing protein n=1 Tax=Thelephora ganbajun TaxID=370292 RepID=A0ACB6ZRU7_THEGA|nr:patatin-domain-containing protein [Thelephora ganbajun]